MSDYDYDRPTRAECNAEAWEDEVREEHIRGLRKYDPWYKQAYARDFGWDNCTPAVMATYGPFVQRLVGAINDKMQAMEEDDEALKECSDAMADAAALNQDPYAYYGVRRSDF